MSVYLPNSQISQIFIFFTVQCILCAKLLQLCPTLCDIMVYRPARLLCPWDPPGKNTGLNCQALLQGIFLTQKSNLHLLCLLHWQVGWVLYHQHHLRFGIDSFWIQSSLETQPLESPQLFSFVPNTFSIFIDIFKQVSKFKNIYWEHPCYLLSVSTTGILSYSLSQTCSSIHPSI